MLLLLLVKLGNVFSARLKRKSPNTLCNKIYIHTFLDYALKLIFKSLSCDTEVCCNSRLANSYKIEWMKNSTTKIEYIEDITEWHFSSLTNAW